MKRRNFFSKLLASAGAILAAFTTKAQAEDNRMTDHELWAIRLDIRPGQSLCGSVYLFDWFASTNGDAVVLLEGTGSQIAVYATRRDAELAVESFDKTQKIGGSYEFDYVVAPLTVSQSFA